MTANETRTRLKVRVSPRALIDEHRARDTTATFDTTATDLAPPLVAVLVDDQPDTIVTLSDDAAAPLGNINELLAEALEHTREHLSSLDPEIVRYATGQGPGVTLVETGDPFATAALLLPQDSLLQWVPELNLTDGILISAPVRHGLLVSPVSEGPALVDSLEKLTSTTSQLYDSNPHPISPLVYLMREVTPTSAGEASTELVPVGGPMKQDDGTMKLTITPTDFLMERLHHTDGE